MAVLDADNFTKSLTPTSDNVASPGTLGGRVRVLQDRITLAAASINDTVRLGRALSVGAKILGAEINTVALGASVTLDLGDVADDNRYMDAVNGNVIATYTDFIQAGAQYEITGTNDTILQLTIEGGAATGLVVVTIYYTED